MGQITVSAAIARLLEQMGTEFVFGLNGHGNWGLLDALVYETKIECISARMEDQAVELADGYWRFKRGGPLPIVTTSVGPGNANIMPAIATAFYESIAMLALVGVGATHWFDRGGIEEAYREGPEDFAGAIRPICKKAVMATRPDTCIDMFLRAYKTALTGRPGPVVMAIPFDIQHALIDEDSLPDPRPYMRIRRPGPDIDGVAEAIGMLKKAKRPLVVFGSGIANSGAHQALLDFAESTGTPVVATSAGKAAFPEKHRLSAGVMGRAGTLHGNHMARRSDLIIGIGTHFTDIDTGGWTLFDIPGNAKLIHVDIDENELGRAYPTDVALNSDARLALEAFTKAAKDAGIKENVDWTAELDKERDAFNEAVKPLRTSNISPLHYARVCEDVSQVIEEKCPEMSVFFDTGHMLSYGPPFVRASSRNVYHSSFMHRMGWSASAAIGASLASGGKPAVALLGDGAFIMRSTVMLTAVEQKLPVIAVVFDNKSLQIEREAMFKIYGRESLCDYRKKGESELWGPDFAKMAEGMGCVGVRVNKAEEFKAAFEAALASGQPTVISVATEIETPQYRSAWYPYPKDFNDTWKPGPIAGQENHGFVMPTFTKPEQ
ncbi:acetolactate synthase-1/2/3 large subunit [Burkholderia sp. OAS925]|uniref:thiamine pyrophosphate-binding protein n=1 Tax=Paraburkholderia TaxID=1822464 RepID=UPI0017894F70|nr:thiamine pyrophosphate-binding protein [Paraburkholderia graminis]MDR6478874.1 acetolactate synthase-1/2/3 large subunit [Paraburkholderia graminis]